MLSLEQWLHFYEPFLLLLLLLLLLSWCLFQSVCQVFPSLLDSHGYKTRNREFSSPSFFFGRVVKSSKRRICFFLFPFPFSQFCFGSLFFVRQSRIRLQQNFFSPSPSVKRKADKAASAQKKLFSFFPPNPPSDLNLESIDQRRNAIQFFILLFSAAVGLSKNFHLWAEEGEKRRLDDPLPPSSRQGNFAGGGGIFLPFSSPRGQGGKEKFAVACPIFFAFSPSDQGERLLRKKG